MQGTIDDAELVAVGPAGETLLPGKCYVYEYLGTRMLHRLVKIEGDSAVFLGDRTTRVEKVNKAAVYGVCLPQRRLWYEHCIFAINIVLYRYVKKSRMMQRLRTGVIRMFVFLGTLRKR